MNTTTHHNMKFEDGFYMNQTAKEDKVMMAALESYKKQLIAEAEYRNKVRSGEIQPAPWGRYNISDRD